MRGEPMTFFRLPSPEEKQLMPTTRLSSPPRRSSSPVIPTRSSSPVIPSFGSNMMWGTSGWMQRPPSPEEKKEFNFQDLPEDIRKIVLFPFLVDPEDAIGYALSIGHAEFAEYFISQNPRYMSIAMSEACKYGNLKFLKYLFSIGASVTPVGDMPFGLNSLIEHWTTTAIRNNHLDILQYLVSQGAPITSQHLQLARSRLFNIHPDIVRYLESVLTPE
jgi:hypothetical protein